MSKENDKKKKLNEKKALFLKVLGNQLKKLRDQKGVVKFSIINDLPGSSVYNVEKGKRDIQVSTLFRILEAHGVLFSDFMKEVEKELPEDFSFIDI